MTTLANDIITAQISTSGAELCSLQIRGREVLWQADKKYWGRHAPVLFPIVGKVFDNQYRIGGRTYSLSQHGFARDSEFELVEATAERCVMRLAASEKTLALYPFAFELTATYTLRGDVIESSWEVRNAGGEVMPFQIGGHPAFNYIDYPEGTDRGYCLFRKGGKALESFLGTRITPGGCAIPGRQLITLDGGMMKLSTSTFDEGVYILEDSQCDEVTLLTNELIPYLTVKSASPVLGIWSPERKDAPFVCIEPWMGRTDPDGYAGEFEDKPWMCRLAPGEALTWSFTIE